jgi:sugar lactone lactonase YvrE
MLSPGLITTVAGSYGSSGASSGGGGPATAALLGAPGSAVSDASGNLYIADTQNHAVRRVDAASGLISTFAGTFGSGGYAGDGSAATVAQLNGPESVALDAGGNLYVADTGNSVIRRVDAASGIITTVAGTGTGGYNGDGVPATAAQLYNPAAVALDAAGDIYIADTYNSRGRGQRRRQHGRRHAGPVRFRRRRRCGHYRAA